MANNHTSKTANPMEHMRPGLGHTPSYQSSGKPWAQTETVNQAGMEFSFPGVTKFISVTNGASGNGHNLKVAFSENGLTTNYFLIGPGNTVTLEVKVTSVFVAAATAQDVAASVCAGITNIPATEIENNWSGSAGVG